MPSQTNNRIRVPGYAQRQFFGDGIEYRPFSPDLVGLQTTSNTDVPLFTMGNFYITTNMAPKSNKTFITNSFSNFITLTDLDLSLERAQALLRNNAGVILNLDKTKINNYALFGSFTEFVRISLENIITNWPASLYVNPIIQSPTDTFALTGYTVQDYSYNTLTQESTFKVSTNVIRNNFQINFLKNGTIIDTFNEANNTRNLTVNYTLYSILYNNSEFDVLGFTGATKTNNDFIYLRVKGDVFAGGSNIGFFVTYHIKPNKVNEEEFFTALPNFESYLLNRLVMPRYTAKFNFPIKSENGLILYVNDSVTWPTTDGYNIDFDTDNYVDYANRLLEISQDSDLYSTNLMTRFLVTESISDFDSAPVFLSELDKDTSGQKMNKALNIYGREFDDINNYINGISFANVVSYDKNDNTPDIYLKNLAKVLGWELVSSILENNLLSNYVTTAPSTYSGHSVGLTPIEADIELWRRLILNSPWLWKSKGPRKAVEFLFKFIGTPNGMINFNEYIYIANGAIDIDLFKNVLRLNGLDVDLSLYPIDSEGYPRPLPNTADLYFQCDGLWFRETGGDNASIDILTGNNPHLGPYDGGSRYLNQFRALIPDFSAVTVSSSTVTTSTTNIFTNYNLGIMNNYSGATYVTTPENSCWSIGSVEITSDPKPKTRITECGCESALDDDILRICLIEPNYETTCLNDYDFYPTIININPKLNDGAYFYTTPSVDYSLNITFDYLFEYDCKDLQAILYPESIDDVYDNCTRPIDVLENIEFKVILEVYTGSTWNQVLELNLFDQIGSGNLYTYLSANTNSGIYIPDLYLDTINDSNACSVVKNSIIHDLFVESGLSGTTSGQTIFNNSLPKNGLNSEWLKADLDITDESIINLLKGNKIRFSLKMQNSCAPICILLDNIEINQLASQVDRHDIYVQNSPGFELLRVKDNKKSWVINNTPQDREFNISRYDLTNSIRDTEYSVSDSRLVLNSKEIDLDINIASAIETDLWCYVADNPCILTGITCVPKFVETITETEESIIITGYSVTTGPPQILTCPSGYNLTPAQDNCVKITNTGSTFNGNGPVISGGSKATSYSNSGAFFYPNIQYSATSLPFNGVPSTFNLINQSGGTISALDISPTGNTFWHNNSTLINGRLNNVGISASTLEWLGFTECFNIMSAGTYYIGLAADNECRFYVDGIKYVELLGSSGADSANFSVWHVFPFELTSGFHIIQMEGRNGGSQAAFGAEIYNPIDYVTLTGATSTGDTGLIFSTANKTGDFYDVGTSIGYSCPSGYSLDRCNGNICTQILNSPPTTGYTSYTSITSTTEIIVVTSTTITYSCCDDLCGDIIPFDTLVSKPLNDITNIDDFRNVISTELIDVKNRQTISSYPTIRALYDRYMNAVEYCSTDSSSYTYGSMNEFADLIGDYWIDLIEQVIPSTTLWGATKILSNTIFDAQKYKYKSYSTLIGTNPFSGNSQVLSPCDGSISDIGVQTEVITNNLNVHSNTSSLFVCQMNSSPEYIGSVYSIGSDCQLQDDSNIILGECTLNSSVETTKSIESGATGTATAIIVGASSNVRYEWSNGGTGATISNLSAGTYSLTVTDDTCCQSTTNFTIEPLLFSACRYSSPENAAWINTEIYSSYTFTMSSLIVNGDEYIVSPEVFVLTPPVTVTTINGIENFDEIVDWINSVFISLGLVNYRAQLSYKTPGVYYEQSQFYIIKPSTDTFNMIIDNNNNYTFRYTEDNLYIDDFPVSGVYYGIDCSGITLSGNTITND